MRKVLISYFIDLFLGNIIYIVIDWRRLGEGSGHGGGEHGRRYEIGEIGRLAASSGPEAALGAWSTCGWWCPATLRPGGAVNICARGRSVTLNVLVRFRKSARFREIVSPYISIVMS